MKVFGNWKSELKKKGAMALTAFMLCGSAGTAFAQSTDITIFDNEKGDVVSDGQPTPGNVKTVTGYQTDIAEGYAANITWGDMLFVYDRGTYDPSTGKLVGSFQSSAENANVGNDESKRTDVEIGGNRAEAGCWYGFNGTNNAVEIENLSTHAIKLTATPESSATNAGEATFSLYVQTSDNDEWSDVSAISNVNHNPNSDDASSNNVWKCGDTETAIGREFAACKFNNDGSVKAADKDWVYLNITGRPGDAFRDETGYKTNSNKGEELGTITLSFAKTDGAETPLTSVHGEDPASNP